MTTNLQHADYKKLATNQSGYMWTDLAASACVVTILAAAFLLAPTRATAQSFQVIYNFQNGTDGGNPPAGLTRDATGNFYGTTSGGGAYQNGTVFKLARSGSQWNLSTLHAFDWNPQNQLSDGAGPHAGVVFGPDGGLYGTTCCGGLPASGGTVFELTPQNGGWNETILYRFTFGPDGGGPPSSVVFDSSGNLYGITLSGGKVNEGVVYKLTPSNGSWSESVVWTFGAFARDGAFPASNLILDQAGNLYGTTSGGGVHGTIYKLTPATTGEQHILYDFRGITDGSFPLAGLVMDSHGNLFGATSLGGPGGGGTVFELSPSGSSWSYHVIYNLIGNGGQTGPYASLLMDQAGSLYGTTYGDGAFRLGSVFKLTPSNGTWQYTDLHDFNGTDGAGPESSLIFDASGNLWGTTVAGGTGPCSGGCGVVFELTP